MGPSDLPIVTVGSSSRSLEVDETRERNDSLHVKHRFASPENTAIERSVMKIVHKEKLRVTILKHTGIGFKSVFFKLSRKNCCR